MASGLRGKQAAILPRRLSSRTECAPRPKPTKLADRLKYLLRPWSILRLLFIACFMAGLFLPPSLSRPLGVLMACQYDQLRGLLENQSSSTAAAAKHLQDIYSRIVDLKWGRKTNRLILDDDLWQALKENIITDWLKNNRQRVAEIIHKNHPNTKTHKEYGQNIHHTVVAREDLVKELEPILEQNVFASKKIKEVEKLVRQALQSSSKAEISEARAKEIIDNQIKSARLEAAARSGTSRLGGELQRQFNHFSVGNGASPDISLSSPTWEITDAHVGSKEWAEAMSTAPRFLPEPVAALTSWNDAGDCWCAGTHFNATSVRPADLAVHLSSFVIPQYIVVEHIRPDATLDPGAMPKNIEVWAAFDEYHQRENLIKFMEVAFPESKKREPELLERKFFQIAQFQYKYDGRDRGVKVEKLSREFAGLKAATDQVLIRATGNHGAADHTCFYRVRLYGEVVKREAKEHESKGWW